VCVYGFIARSEMYIGMNISKKYVYSKFNVIYLIYHNVSFNKTIDRVCYKTTFLFYVVIDSFWKLKTCIYTLTGMYTNYVCKINIVVLNNRCLWIIQVWKLQISYSGQTRSFSVIMVVVHVVVTDSICFRYRECAGMTEVNVFCHI